MAPPPAAIETLAETDTSTFTIPDRLTIQSIAKRRAASGKLIAGVAAHADIELFKGRVQHLHKPKALRFDHRLTVEAQARKGSSLKAAALFLKTPGLISLGGGLPSSEYFPFDELDIRVPRIPSLLKQEEDGFAPDSYLLRSGKHDQAEDKSCYDIATSFQYGQGHGSAQLLRWIVEHTEVVHNPPYQDWSCSMTTGSTSSFYMGLRMLTQPGDWMLTEEYSYPAAVEAAAPLGVRSAAIAMDEYGMLACALDATLSNWDVVARRGPKPVVVYTVPTGQNPTGATQTLQRRREIYAVAQKHDLIIFEDEPYYFLQMDPYVATTAESTAVNGTTVAPPASYEDFLKSLVPSFLSMDVDGRVMRMDSFSKVIAPGSRLGWITASEQLVDRYRTYADLTTQGPSGISQLVLFKLLDEHWGHTGYLDWLIHIRLQYTARRDVMMRACEEHLPKDVVSWKPPMAGMFHWLRIDYQKHPHYPQKTLSEIEDELFLTIIQHKTLLMKGSWFCADREVPMQTMFFRATYAAAPFDLIQEAISRFGAALRDSFQLN